LRDNCINLSAEAGERDAKRLRALPVGGGPPRPTRAPALKGFDFKPGETDMGDKGKRDKGKREQQKKAQRTPQEKRKAKQDKRNQSPG
jgi:hypothetical protein